MPVIIDLIGGMMVAGYVILLGLRINTNINNSATASITNVNIQEAMVEINTIMESDWRKIGFGLSDPTRAIAIADSQKIRFFADMDQNGTIDSVQWSVGPPIMKINRVNITTTKKDTIYVRNLYRTYNNQAAKLTGVNVTSFKLNYLDQDGTTTNVLTNISMIETTISISSPYRIADQINPDSLVYASTIWRQGRLSTKNTKRHG